MRSFGLAVGAAVLVAAQATAADSQFERILKSLGPDERLEQLCDFTAMTQIRNDPGNYRPDRAVANATALPSVARDTIEAKGAAFRSRGKWYALSYKCAATPDHFTVLSFEFKVGAEIPESKWAAYNLWE